MRRHRVFISSTIEDLRTQRDAAETALTQLGFFDVVRVESLPARGESSERVCVGEVGAAAALILILHKRYGFVPPERNPEGLSVTHIEYREARRMGIPVYAFISTDRDREPLLEIFISEVADYSFGLFRRTWLSVDDLQREVRRSAVEWLSSDLRAGRMLEAIGLVAEERGTIAIDIAGLDVVVQDGPAWLAAFLEQLEDECKGRHLPAPISGGVPTVTAYTVEVSRSATASASDVTLLLTPSTESVAQPESAAVSIRLDSPPPSVAAAAAAALLEAAVHDASSAVLSLIALAGDTEAGGSTNPEWLLQAAATLSAVSSGVHGEKVVEAMLRLSHLNADATSVGVLCLMAARVRQEAAGAWRGVEGVDQLSFELLSTAIERSDARPGALYNLGRQALLHSRRLGLELFDALLAAEPSYEERWYFHRDLGLIEYASRNYSAASDHYDHACHLKCDDPELWRQAGDARYYEGQWAEALLRYQKALALDEVESYYVDFKVGFCRAQIAAGRADSRHFKARFIRSARIATLGDRLASSGRERLARPLFGVAKRVCALSFDADRWLALYANRNGSYQVASEHLSNALAAIPEDPFVRMNLSANLIFGSGGVLPEDATQSLRASFFHAGPQMLERFAVQMTNSDNSEYLIARASVVLDEVTAERGAWLERRGEIHAPEQYGSTIHIEIR